MRRNRKKKINLIESLQHHRQAAVDAAAGSRGRSLGKFKLHHDVRVLRLKMTAHLQQKRRGNLVGKVSNQSPRTIGRMRQFDRCICNRKMQPLGQNSQSRPQLRGQLCVAFGRINLRSGCQQRFSKPPATRPDFNEQILRSRRYLIDNHIENMLVNQHVLAKRRRLAHLQAAAKAMAVCSEEQSALPVPASSYAVPCPTEARR